jgi:hypothetical protein
VISFRTHVVTLVAVFLALAVGVVLGGGPLSELGRGEGENTAALEAKLDAARVDAAFGADFASEVSSTLLPGALKGRDIALVTFPGARPATVEALTGLVKQAGGTVTAVQEVGSSLVNTGEKSLVDTLGSQLMGQVPSGSVTASASTYERAGELLALTLATDREQGDEPTSQTKAVADGLKGANLVPQAAAVSQRAPLVLAVLGEEVTGNGGDDIVAGLLRGIARRTVGTVVVSATADQDSQLARLRDAEMLGDATSVDGVEGSVGQVSAVLGLRRALDTRGGDFGATGSDGSVPLR